MRFSPQDLQTIYDNIFGDLPDSSYVWNENRFTYEETMIIALHYMANGTKYIEMAEIYGHDWSRYSYMVNFFAKFVFHKYYHLLCGRSLEKWVDQVHDFRYAIWKYVCFDNKGNQDIDIPFEHFRIFGWIDCLMHLMCMPGAGPRGDDDKHHPENYDTQRAFFSNYAKGWGMKSQVLAIPNGIVASLFFTSLTDNDKGVINISGIEEELERVLQPYRLHNNTVFPAIYGDQIYDVSSVIVQSGGRNDDFHIRMNSSRIDIEHMFGARNNLWKRDRVKHSWKLLRMKNHVREHIFSLFFMTNIHTCCNGCKTALKYNFEKIDVNDYLNVNMDDAYDGDDANEYIIELLNSRNA